MQVKLKVLVGKSAGKEIAVPAPRFLIGRSNDCHLRPKSDSVSRNHCTILTRDDHVVIRDLNSRNGTFVNGQRISEDEVIKNGDQLQIGKLEFSVVVKQPKKKKKKPKEKPPKEKAGAKPESSIKDPDSLEFDVTEWLQEVDGDARKSSEPETRQFQLDETDRLALANATAEAEDEEAEEQDESKQKGPPDKKKKPGKLPQRPADNTNSSREAAADMLKKFFNNR